MIHIGGLRKAVSPQLRWRKQHQVGVARAAEGDTGLRRLEHKRVRSPQRLVPPLKQGPLRRPPRRRGSRSVCEMGNEESTCRYRTKCYAGMVLPYFDSVMSSYKFLSLNSFACCRELEYKDALASRLGRKCRVMIKVFSHLPMIRPPNFARCGCEALPRLKHYHSSCSCTHLYAMYTTSHIDLLGMDKRIPLLCARSWPCKLIACKRGFLEAVR